MSLLASSPHRGKASLSPLLDVHQVTRELTSRGVLSGSGRLGRRQTAHSVPLTMCRRRLNRIVRSVNTPQGQDADLLLLVAYAGGLETASAADHLGARHLIAALDGRHADPPPLLSVLSNEVGVDSAAQLADKLLPGRVRVRPGDLDPGINSAVWGGGHGGGTLG